MFRSPSNNSNGNTFDFEGRQLSCEHLTRRVVRYEHDGTVTVIAEAYDGKRLNSPNDVGAAPRRQLLVHRSAVRPQPVRRAARDARAADRRLSGRSEGHESRSSCTEEQVPDPNGSGLLARLQEAVCRQHRKGTGRHGPRRQRQHVRASMSARDNTAVESSRRFSDFMIDGVKCSPDGVRCDVDGNVWCSSNAGRAVGYSGVTVWTPQGKLIGRIRLPEVCGNLCFGGPKRNRLFMAASQSLYAVYVNTQGAGPG